MMYLHQDGRALQPLIHFNSSKPDIGERAALVKVGSKPPFSARRPDIRNGLEAVGHRVVC